MPSNKPRLQLALYARPKHPDSPHYALLITPKITGQYTSTTTLPATKFHVKNTLQNIDCQLSQPWRFERIPLSDLSRDPRLLACFVIGKIAPRAIEAVENIIAQVPVYQIDDPDQAKAQSFNCCTWVEDVLTQLRGSGHVARLMDMDWQTVQKEALAYVVSKRREGRWDAGRCADDVPVMDLLTGTELVP
ncbi:hypothetical protein MPDQ_005618 [Monascus purpureus]|uniref:Uncharacterized protein n=1 Tax=Monascus purpureus TaxID=5098 RepID=A0A507QYH3_MONPU|nr:hypothetical protein MPDQ_005618 [Monascus purpureus]BDD56214.1 hypothetical protein MAP00_001688 [Monascus purpureus]